MKIFEVRKLGKDSAQKLEVAHMYEIAQDPHSSRTYAAAFVPPILPQLSTILKPYDLGQLGAELDEHGHSVLTLSKQEPVDLTSVGINPNIVQQVHKAVKQAATCID